MSFVMFTPAALIACACNHDGKYCHDRSFPMNHNLVSVATHVMAEYFRSSDSARSLAIMFLSFNLFNLMV